MRESLKSWLEELMSQDRRKNQRQISPPLVAYYWDGASPSAHPIRDISPTGLYLLTEQRWYPGTMITMTLQRIGNANSASGDSVAVQSKVVRLGADGVGLAFVRPPKLHSRQGESPLHFEADKKTLAKFLRQGLQDSKGQALIEYILMLPLLFLLIVNVVNFGGFFFAWITVANAARAGADYAIMGGASVGAPSLATATQINNLITQDISSLPNRASLSVSICQNNNAATATLLGTCSSFPTDPEPATYVATSIDVTYTYNPFIPAGFKFPNLNIYATIPPTTIHRRAAMRSIQ